MNFRFGFTAQKSIIYHIFVKNNDRGREGGASEIASGLTVFLARSNFPAARGATIFIAPLYVLFSFLQNNYFIYIIFHILSTYS
jgi:hypothetical protein